MDIDKLYRTFGVMFKRAWNQFVSRPVKNYNVEHRAQKALERKQPAPWHETTKQVIAEMKKESNFEQYNKFDSNLASRLKSVKVVSTDEARVDETISQESKSKLPQERFLSSVPYVFNKPETVPHGKITAVDTLDMLATHQRENTSLKMISAQYGISEVDAENIIKYVSVFKSLKRPAPTIDTDHFKEVFDEDQKRQDSYAGRDGPKRDARKKAQAEAAKKQAAEEELVKVGKTK